MGKYDFIAIDFETANNNFNSACSIGIAAVKNNVIVDEFYSLIKPPTLDFNPYSVDVHGITADTVISSPTFAELWPQISHYFDDELLVAFNASYDMNVLYNCLYKYNLDIPMLKYVCSMQLCTQLMNISKNVSLEESCEYFGVDLINHHNASYDAIACANVFIKANEHLNSLRMDQRIIIYSHLDTKFLNEIKPAKEKKTITKRTISKKINIKDITTTKTEFDTTHIFYNKNVLFTGALQKISLHTAMQHVVDLGGQLKSGISKKVDFLIVGVQDLSIVGPDGKSTKERTALEYIENGHHIKILTEEEFLKLI